MVDAPDVVGTSSVGTAPTTSWQIFTIRNSLSSSDTYMRPEDKPSLVEIMAFRLFGAQLSFEPMLEYCQFGTYKQISVKS